jgi:hypothetical protein
MGKAAPHCSRCGQSSDPTTDFSSRRDIYRVGSTYNSNVVIADNARNINSSTGTHTVQLTLYIEDYTTLSMVKVDPNTRITTESTM